MRKKSKYKPREIKVDAVSWVLSGLKPFNQIGYSTTLRIRNHAAMDVLRKGDATLQDLDTLIGAFNMCEAYTMLRPELGLDWKEEIGKGLDALHSVGKRGYPTKRFILTAQELQAMNLVMEIHDEQLNNTTVQDMEKAMEIVDKEYRSKRMRPIAPKNIKTTTPV
jgi:hypothetical protein